MCIDCCRLACTSQWWKCLNDVHVVHILQFPAYCIHLTNLTYCLIITGCRNVLCKIGFISCASSKFWLRHMIITCLQPLPLYFIVLYFKSWKRWCSYFSLLSALFGPFTSIKRPRDYRVRFVCDLNQATQKRSNYYIGSLFCISKAN